MPCRKGPLPAEPDESDHQQGELPMDLMEIIGKAAAGEALSAAERARLADFRPGDAGSSALEKRTRELETRIEELEKSALTAPRTNTPNSPGCAKASRAREPNATPRSRSSPASVSAAGSRASRRSTASPTPTTSSICAPGTGSIRSRPRRPGRSSNGCAKVRRVFSSSIWPRVHPRCRRPRHGPTGAGTTSCRFSPKFPP